MPKPLDKLLDALLKLMPIGIINHGSWVWDKPLCYDSCPPSPHAAIHMIHANRRRSTWSLPVSRTLKWLTGPPLPYHYPCCIATMQLIFHQCSSPVWPPLCSASTSSNTTLSLFIFTGTSTFFPVLVFTTVNQASEILPYRIIHWSSRPILWHCSFITDTKWSKPHPLLPAWYQPTHHVHRLSCPATTSECSSMLVHEQFPSGAHEEIPIHAASVIAMSHSSY